MLSPAAPEVTVLASAAEQVVDACNPVAQAEAVCKDGVCLAEYASSSAIRRFEMGKEWAFVTWLLIVMVSLLVVAVYLQLQILMKRSDGAIEPEDEPMAEPDGRQALLGARCPAPLRERRRVSPEPERWDQEPESESWREGLKRETRSGPLAISELSHLKGSKGSQSQCTYNRQLQTPRFQVLPADLQGCIAGAFGLELMAWPR